MIVNVHAGDCFITDQENEVAATILGSCISACMHDPVAEVGGMNHFLLPNTVGFSEDSARFGAFAMEQLINELLKRGAQRSRLEAKLFGGGNVIESSALIGSKNAQFAVEYLACEGIHLLGTDIGGTFPRKVRYHPASRRAMVRKLRREHDYRCVNQEEEGYRTRLAQTKIGNDIKLF